MEQERSLWWLHPASVVGGFTGLVILAAHAISAQSYLTNWRTPKYLDNDSLLLMLGCVAFFVAGSVLIGMRPSYRMSRPAAREQTLDPKLLRKLLIASYCLAMLGYLVWAAMAVGRGLSLGVILAVLKGENGVSYTIREQYLGSVAGITTCTQFGIATVILAGWSGLRRRTLLLWGTPLAALTLLRVLLNSERLAMIELLVPLAVIFVQRLNIRTAQRSVRTFLKALPVGGFGLLFVVFSAFEYFRSWATYYSGGTQSFWEFSASRLLGYYVTALNNGACVLHFMPDTFHLPLYTLGFLWQTPFVKDLTQDWLPQAFSGMTYYGLLERAANPEFNNSGGLLLPIFDLGVWAGLLYWMLAGAVCGLLYRWFQSEHAWGLCLYPFVYITLIEVPRGLHWTATRALPAFCFLVLSALFLRIQQKRVAAATPMGVSDPTRQTIAVYATQAGC